MSSRCSQPAYTPSAGAAVIPSVGTLAVGKPSSRPRWSPATTTPRTAYGWPSASGRPGHVAGGQAGADVGRRPDHRAAVERDPLDGEAVLAPRTPAAWRRRRRPWCRTGSWRRPRRPRRGGRRPAPAARTPPASTTPCPGRTAAPARGRRRPRRAARRGARSWSAGSARARGAAPPSGAGRTSPRPACSPRSSATSRARASTVRCPRCTPSKLPIVTTVRPRSAGTSASERQISTARNSRTHTNTATGRATPSRGS